MDRTVAEIKNLLDKGVLQKSDIVHLMTLFRVLLEEEKIQKEYPYLNLYSTWVVHPELTRNITCLRVLVDLTTILSVPDPKAQKLVGAPWVNYLHFRINEALGLPQLRKNIIETEKRFGLPISRLPIDSVWKNFALILISCIFERPIKLPDEAKKNKRTKEIYGSIQKLSNNDPRKEVVEIVFLPREKAATFGNNPVYLPNNCDIYWCLTTSIGSFILGPLQVF